MSGPFPHHQAGGVPVSMNNFANWNQNAHQHPQGQGMSSGTPQSVVHGTPPQPLLQSSNQLTGSSPKAIKNSNVTHNGATGGHMAVGVISQNSLTPPSGNMKPVLQMYPNQNCPSLDPSIALTSAPSGSLDLSHSPRTGELIKPVSPGTHQESKVSNISGQNPSVISCTGISGQLNGEVHSRAPAVVSVIANAATSPIKTGPDSSQTSPCNVNQTQNMKGVAPETIVKQEPQPAQEATSVAVKVSPKSSVEPPFKKFKEEEGVRYVNNSVIVGSSPSSAPSIKMEPSPSVSSSHPSPAPNLSNKQDAMDVESQLEALFAGIADDGNSAKESKVSPVNLQGTPNVAAVLESKGSTAKKGKGKANGVVKSADVAGTTSAESTPKKKRKKKTVKPWEDDKHKKGKKGTASKGKYVKEASCDSGSNASSIRVRGPVVHIEGTKDAPTSLSVVNAPSRQDDEDNDSKKKMMASGRVRKSHAVEGKVSSSGLCSNSLVSRYESHSSDPRWVCVFCKRGCHTDGLGDLFGPYLVNHDTELENSLDLDADVDRKSGDKKDKKKRSGIGQTGVLGLLAIPPLPGEQTQFMVYFHENCAVWSPSIHLIGSRLIGIQESVWVAVRTKCSRCHLDGANMGCAHHGCSCQVHYPCARDGGWSVEETTFISMCHMHKKVPGPPLLLTADSL